MKFVFGLLILVLASMVSCRTSHDIQAKHERRIARAKRNFMERTSHMSKARLRSLGTCVQELFEAIKVLGKSLRKECEISRDEGDLSNIIKWTKQNICTGGPKVGEIFIPQ